MSKNYMEEVAKMLGVELGEAFRLKDNKGDFLNGVFWIEFNDLYYTKFNPVSLIDILKGRYMIVRNKWYPKKHTKYYWYDCSNSVVRYTTFIESEIDMLNIIYENYFKSESECLKNSNCIKGFVNDYNKALGELKGVE